MLRAKGRNSIWPPLVPLIVVGTAALMSLAAAQLAVAAPFVRGSTAGDCSSAGAATRAMARHAGRPAVVTEQLDASGVFTGRGLALPGRTTVTLPPDSFVAPAVGDALVYTSSTGGRSEIHLVDLGAACDAVLARLSGVVRSAILSPDGSAVYIHSVSFPNRTDAGVTRYALAGGQQSSVVPPLPENARFGPTFATQLGWSTDGATLSVQSCAIESCRTRLVDVATGRITTFDADDQGPMVGVTPTHLVTYAACGGLPCPVLSIDRASGATRTLADEGYAATMTSGTSGTVVRIETADGAREVPQ